MDHSVRQFGVLVVRFIANGFVLPIKIAHVFVCCVDNINTRFGLPSCRDLIRLFVESVLDEMFGTCDDVADCLPVIVNNLLEPEASFLPLFCDVGVELLLTIGCRT